METDPQREVEEIQRHRLDVYRSRVLAGVLAGVATLVGGRAYDRRYRRRADALAGDRPLAARPVAAR